ncbi:class I SAM-dependent methyltransferase [bacterium]|nr:class I SAM-dependent methyltransferase [bacterium]
MTAPETKTWDRYWSRIPIYDDALDALRGVLNRQIKRYVKTVLAPRARTLEPGAGSACVSALLAEDGLNASALDYAYSALAVARRFQSGARLVQGDLFKMPFPDGTFDLTFNNSTLEHFKNPQDALNEMARVTKPGGHVFVGVPFTYGPLAVCKLKKSSFKGAWDGTTYDRKGLRDLFGRAGLRVIGDATFFFRCFVGLMGRKA